MKFSYRKHSGKLSLCSVVGVLLSTSILGIAHGEEIDPRSELTIRLRKKYGNVHYLGVADESNNGCMITGIQFDEPPYVVNLDGSEITAVNLGQAVELPGTEVIASSTRTFQNCNDSPWTASRNFSTLVQRSLSMSFSNTYSKSFSMGFDLSKVPVVGSLGTLISSFSSNQSWSVNETKTQSETRTITESDNYSGPIPPHSALEVSYIVRTRQVKIPFTVEGVFDGGVSACAIIPGHTNAIRVSDLLSKDERTIRLSGTIRFDLADAGQFDTSTRKTTTCQASPQQAEPGTRTLRHSGHK